MKLVIMQFFLPSAAISSVFGQNILLSNLFSNAINLCSSLNVKDQVSYSFNPLLIIYRLLGTDLQLLIRFADLSP
jgi:hypothetical protein